MGFAAHLRPIFSPFAWASGRCLASSFTGVVFRGASWFPGIPRILRGLRAGAACIHPHPPPLTTIRSRFPVFYMLHCIAPSDRVLFVFRDGAHIALSSFLRFVSDSPRRSCVTLLGLRSTLVGVDHGQKGQCCFFVAVLALFQKLFPSASKQCLAPKTLRQHRGRSPKTKQWRRRPPHRAPRLLLLRVQTPRILWQSLRREKTFFWIGSTSCAEASWN